MYRLRDSLFTLTLEYKICNSFQFLYAYLHALQCMLENASSAALHPSMVIGDDVFAPCNQQGFKAILTAKRMRTVALAPQCKLLSERIKIKFKFVACRCENHELPNVDWVLEKAQSAVLRYGIRGLVIDPYNELDHRRPRTMSETEYISQILTKIKRFAQVRRTRRCHRHNSIFQFSFFSPCCLAIISVFPCYWLIE